MRRAVILAAVLTLLITTPVCASAKNDGDAAGCGGLYEPFLVSYTCYIDQGIGSHGDPVQDGMIAGHPAWYGMTVVIYEAVPEEDGSYNVGPYIESGMILDTGYLAMMDASVQMDVQSVKGLKNKMLGGEGFFNTVVHGPGHVILQSMPIYQTALELFRYMPSSSN